jgi:hypothetical protein
MFVHVEESIQCSGTGGHIRRIREHGALMFVVLFPSSLLASLGTVVADFTPTASLHLQLGILGSTKAATWMDFAFLVSVAVVTYKLLHSVLNAVDYWTRPEDLFPVVDILRGEQASTSSRYF